MRSAIRTFTIAKEDLHHVQFAKKDVLINKNQQQKRCQELTIGSKLGNILKNKVSIYFLDKNDRLMKVHTTIWAVTKQFVVLKNATTIPIKSIVGVE